MNILIIKKPAFSVIGKEGGSYMGPNMEKTLWGDVNAHFEEISSLGALNAVGKYVGFWGLMSDPERKMKPWENNFTKGLYLAGLQVRKGAEVPNKAWKKWDVPEHTYLICEVTKENRQASFYTMVYFQIAFEGYLLAASPFDFTDPSTQKKYLFFPVRENILKASSEDRTSKIARCGLHCGYCFFTQCKGCGLDEGFCSFASSQPDKKCPNVECSLSKGLEGCFACQELPQCHKGFFADEGQIAHASSLFIAAHGKKDLEKAIKNMIGDGLNYNKFLVDLGDDSARLSKLEEYLSK